jgi:hypothetical protein
LLSQDTLAISRKEGFVRNPVEDVGVDKFNRHDIATNELQQISTAGKSSFS